MKKRGFVSFLAVSLTTALWALPVAQTQTVGQQEAYEIARDAYVYAYPLMLMDVFIRQSTNYAEPTGLVTQAPFNRFSHANALYA